MGIRDHVLNVQLDSFNGIFGCMFQAKQVSYFLHINATTTISNYNYCLLIMLTVFILKRLQA